MAAEQRAQPRRDSARAPLPSAMEAHAVLDATTGETRAAWIVIRREMEALRAALTKRRQETGTPFTLADARKIRAEAAKWRTRCRELERRLAELEVD